MKRILLVLLLSLTACTSAAQPTASPPPATQATAPATQTQAPTSTSTSTAIPPTDTPTRTPTATPSPTDTPTPTPTETPSPTNTPKPTHTAAPTRTPAPTDAAKPTTAATRPTVPTATSAPITKADIALVIQKVGYDYWGRPKSMDDPASGSCGPFDDGHPMLRLLISIAATNNTGKDWPSNSELVGFLKTDGSRAHWCFYDYMNGGQYPVIHPGETFQVTLGAFVERNERVTSILFGVKDIGYTSAKIPADLPIP